MLHVYKSQVLYSAMKWLKIGLLDYLAIPNGLSQSCSTVVKLVNAKPVVAHPSVRVPSLQCARNASSSTRNDGRSRRLKFIMMLLMEEMRNSADSCYAANR